MSAIWVKISTILCLCYAAEMKGVIWKEAGQYITIQCRITTRQDSLNLKKGINKETVIVTIDGATKKETVVAEMRERVQIHEKFPNVDILIKNLSRSDTGPYWCEYTGTDETMYTQQTTTGDGSVLLVVPGDSQAAAPTKPPKECDPSRLSMAVVYIVIAVAVLFIIMIFFIVWIMRKNKTSDNMVKPRRMENDVYEDMRGTIRR
ncbi:uncharacterized protein LOC105933020 [Fundulus heteroclitus]|uniref:uncharacterized protein LOC105933020 n=1 Tax=Fundulus heteroclitus TaxID=8078 RepID=UPI00165B7A87|nr:uncharacterized protein LOC105933020 [Fundulus heteroclitus]